MDLNEQEQGCAAIDDHDVTEGIKEDELRVLIHILDGKSINFYLQFYKGILNLWIELLFLIYIKREFWSHNRDKLGLTS